MILTRRIFFTWEEIKLGVQQGSILGQLLFLLYINDLARIVNDKNKPRLFADNTSHKHQLYIVFTYLLLVHYYYYYYYYYIIYLINIEYYFLYISSFLLTSLMLQCNYMDENIIIIVITTTAQQLKQCCKLANYHRFVPNLPFSCDTCNKRLQNPEVFFVSWIIELYMST